MTLLELTLVILVLMTFVALLFVGTRAWKRGTDRTICILNIEAVQKGVRGYANMNDLQPGDHVAALKNAIIGTERFIRKAPSCPGHGHYDFGDTTDEETIPPLGVLYMKCTLSETLDHQPVSYWDW